VAPAGEISLGRVAVAAVVWAGAVAGAVALSSAVAHSTHRAAGSPPSASAPTGTGSSAPTGTSSTTTQATPVPPFDPASVKPTDRRSLFRTTNFARALRAVRSRYGDVDIGELRLSPGEAQFTLLVAGEQRSVGVRANGQYVTLFERPLHGSAQAFTLSQVHANVPAALARRIAAHGGVSTSQLEYMLIRIDPAAHAFSWLVYRVGGDVHFQADGATSPITEYGSGGVRTLSG
jgi:hypothetical protein